MSPSEAFEIYLQNVGERATGKKLDLPGDEILLLDAAVSIGFAYITKLVTAKEPQIGPNAFIPNTIGDNNEP